MSVVLYPKPIPLFHTDKNFRRCVIKTMKCHLFEVLDRIGIEGTLVKDPPFPSLHQEFGPTDTEHLASIELPWLLLTPGGRIYLISCTTLHSVARSSRSGSHWEDFRKNLSETLTGLAALRSTLIRASGLAEDDSAIEIVVFAFGCSDDRYDLLKEETPSLLLIGQVLNFDCAYTEIDTENLSKSLKDRIRKTFRNHMTSGCETLISNFDRWLSKDRRMLTWRYREGFLSSPNGLGIYHHKCYAIGHHNDLVKQFDYYFHEFDKVLRIFPPVASIPGGVLSAGRYGCDINSESGYRGEVQDFLREMVYPLRISRGILLHGVTQRSLQFLLDIPKDIRFEFDWIYVSRGKVVVFEVSRIESRDATKRIEKKIQQLFNTIIPNFQMILAGLSGLENISGLEESTTWVLFLPNVSLGELSKSLQQTNVRCLLRKVSPSVRENVRILVDESLPTKYERAVAYKLWGDNDYKILPDVPVGRLFADSIMPNKESIDVYAKLTLSAYNCDNRYPELSLYERFKKSQTTHLKKNCSAMFHDGRYLDELACANIILSPEQAETLAEDNRFTIVYGEAGSGKTSLLLACVIRLCGKHLEGKPDLPVVAYGVPPGKQYFIQFLQQFASKYCARGHMQVVPIKQFDVFVQPVRPKLCIFLDELYPNATTELWMKTFNRSTPVFTCSYFWASFVKSSTVMKEYALKFPGFRVVFTKTLYRNASHVSRTATYLMAHNLNRGSVLTSPTHFMPYESSQRRIEPMPFADKTRLQKLLDETLMEQGGQCGTCPPYCRYDNSGERTLAVCLESVCHEGCREFVAQFFREKTNVDLVFVEHSSLVDAKFERGFCYGGVEWNSVILIMLQTDPLPEHLLGRLLYGAMTRAVYNFHLFVHIVHYRATKDLLLDVFDDILPRCVLSIREGELSAVLAAKLSASLVEETRSGKKHIPREKLSLIESCYFIAFELAQWHIIQSLNNIKKLESLKNKDWIRAFLRTNKSKQFIDRVDDAWGKIIMKYLLGKNRKLLGELFIVGCFNGFDENVFWIMDNVHKYAASFRGIASLFFPILEREGNQQEGAGNPLTASPKLSMCLIMACGTGNASIVNHLLDKSTAEEKAVLIHWSVPGCPLMTAFFAACVQANLDIVRRLLVEDRQMALCALTDNGWSPLHLACRTGKFEMCRLICSFFNSEETLTLVRHKEKRASLMLTASYSCDLTTCQWVHAEDCTQFNEPTEEGITPLAVNILFGNLEIVSWLVNDLKCDLFTTDPRVGQWIALGARKTNQAVASFILQKFQMLVSREDCQADGSPLYREITYSIWSLCAFIILRVLHNQCTIDALD